MERYGTRRSSGFQAGKGADLRGLARAGARRFWDGVPSCYQVATVTVRTVTVSCHWLARGALGRASAGRKIFF